MNYTEAQLDNMTLEELRELALSTGATEAEVPAEEQPRDDKGRFVSQSAPEAETPTQEEVEEPAVEEPTLYRREIDLGDGSGKQVFEAETLEELVDKLANAQIHATRKIRELNRTVKETSPPPAPKPLTKDEEFVVSQQLQSEPSKAFELLFERHMGMPLAEFRQLSTQAKQIASAKANDDAANAWVASHPEYAATPANGKKMNAAIQRFYGGVMTPENLDAVYADLKAEGLIQDKPEQTAPAPPPATTTRVVRRSSGLPISRTAPAPAKSKQLTQAELESMPLDKLRELANGGQQYGGW